VGDLKLNSSMFDASGIMSVHDAMMRSGDLRAYRGCLQDVEISLRIYALMTYDCFKHLSYCGAKTGFGNQMLRIGGAKLAQ
jgi:hypothetical protein